MYTIKSFVRRHLLDVVVAAILSLALITPSQAGVPQYTVVDLNALSGNIGAWGYTFDINADGWVIGSIFNQRDFVSNGVQVRWLGSLPNASAGYLYYPRGLNDNGLVVGEAINFQTSNYIGFLYNGSSMVSLPYGPFIYFAASDINNNGQIVGFGQDGSNNSYAAVYDGTNWLTLVEGRGNNINEKGWVTGGTYRSAFIHDGTTVHDIGVTLGTDSIGYAINENGQVAGAYCCNNGNVWQAFLYDGTAAHDLGTLPNTNTSYAYGINNYGWVVGYSDNDGAGGSSRHGFLYDGSTMHDLNGLLNSISSGWVISFAGGINDKGQIAAYGTVNGSYPIPILLNPVPTISEINPNNGNDTTSITATIQGNWFVNATTAKLVQSGQPDIVGSSITVDNTGSSLTATFDLSGKAAGAWDVVVTSPGGGSATLPQGFTITANDYPVSVSLTGTGAGTVASNHSGIVCPGTCSAQFSANSTVTLTATPDADSTFSNWSGACTGNGICQVTLDAAKNVTAVFAAKVPLTVTKAGTGQGTVVSNPAGIACPGTCSANFESDSAVTLTATPNANSLFSGWSGACTGTGACQVTLDTAKNVTATFVLKPQTLTITQSGGGTGIVASNPAGIACPGTCNASFGSGTAVILTATPDINSTFFGWSGDCSGTGPCQVTLDSAKTVTASFSTKSLPPPQTHPLTVSQSGTGNGAIASNPAGIACPDTCSANFTSGSVITLTATPDANSTFTGWSGACSGTGACQVTLDAVKNVIAAFSVTAVPPPQAHPVTVSQSGTGSGIVTSTPAGIACPGTCSANFDSGSIIILSAAPDANSTFTGWGGACTDVGVCQITVNSATTVSATFDASITPPSPTPLLTVIKAGEGRGKVKSIPEGIQCGKRCSKKFRSGKRIVLKAIPARQSTFAGWGGNCIGSDKCRLTMNGNKSVTAIFQPSN
jgi:probable HAF family extracellular repeat protein